jgi:ribosomal protein S18 acetylase RimI-like enzyme
MDEEILRGKGVSPLRPRKAVVPGYRLRIGRRALLVPQAGAQAFGMVFALTDREIASLYAEPGLELYRPESVIASFQDGTSSAVTTFNLSETDAVSEPNLDYATKLRVVFERLGFPTDDMPSADVSIREARAGDEAALWRILEPIIREGSTYALPTDMSEEAGMKYWCAPAHEVFVAVSQGEIVGTYFMRPNQAGGGGHVANCGYMTAPWAVGRGVARAMCAHSLERARARGYRAMQFNFVVSTNERAVRLWQDCGFEVVGRLPLAFQHPRHGYVDALVMYRAV